MNDTPLADGQTGALGDGARLHADADAAGVLVDVLVEADPCETEVVPTLMAAPIDGFGFALTVAVPDLR